MPACVGALRRGAKSRGAYGIYVGPGGPADKSIVALLASATKPAGLRVSLLTLPADKPGVAGGS